MMPVNSSTAADELDSLNHTSSSGIARHLRNPQILCGVIVLLTFVLLLIIGLWAWMANQPSPNVNNSCPPDSVAGIFEALFRDWLASVVLYTSQARILCDATKARMYETELRLNAFTFSGALGFYGGPASHSVWAMSNWTEPILLLVDTTLACPCSAPVFGPCGDVAAATYAKQAFAQASEALLQYIYAVRKPAYDLGQLRGQMAQLSSAIYKFIIAARDTGVEDAGAFGPSVDLALLAATQQGMMLDWQDSTNVLRRRPVKI